MLKKITTIIFFAAITAGSSFAQWTYEGVFPPANPDTVLGSTHGIAVDPDGKVWYGDYFANEKIVNTAGDTVSVRSIRCYKADGEPASFSPITVFNLSAFVSDTLWGAVRGMRADADGNILVTTSAPAKLYRINYQTGEAMNILDLATTPQGGNSPTAPAVDANGNIFVGPVVPGNPLVIFDKDFNYIGNAIDATIGFSRAFEVSPDGNTIYWAGYTNGAVYVYNRPDEFSTFDSVATVLEGFHAESFAWNPANGNLYASAGSYNDLPDNGYAPGGWYAYDVVNDAIVDSFKWDFMVPEDANERPRAIGFSPDGTIAYVGAFGTTTIPAIQKFTNPNIVGVKKDENIEIAGYSLSQNYPNPFNPSTTIRFSIKKSDFVSLKVYNALGEEVADLVNAELTKGKYSVDFNAAGLASGIYIYQLRTNNVRLSKKMQLLK